MKKVNNFQIAKVQPQVSFCLIFCQYQPGVAYKYFAFKKSMYLENSRSKYCVDEKVFLKSI